MSEQKRSRRSAKLNNEYPLRRLAQAANVVFFEANKLTNHYRITAYVNE
jgi:hypothetical protein